MKVKSQKSKVKSASQNAKVFSLLICLFAISFLLFHFSHAETTLEVGIPGQKEAGGTVSGPSEYIRFVYLFVLGFVGIAGFVTIVIWGTAWVASGVGPDKKAAALEGIRNSLIGIGIAFLAFIMLNTINPDLVANRAPDVGEVKVAPAKSSPIIASCIYEGQPLATSCTDTSYTCMWVGSPGSCGQAGVGYSGRSRSFCQPFPPGFTVPANCSFICCAKKL